MPSDEHDRTIGLAEIALGQIRALSQAASPRNYEIWYHYATGHNPALNQLINETLKKEGSLTESDLDRIYTACVATNHAGDRIGAVNDRMLDEVGQVLEIIGTAGDSAGIYSETLAAENASLFSAKDGDALRGIVERLVTGTKVTESNNKNLQARLASSKQEIEKLQQNLQAVRNESMTDPLTTLANRKFFDRSLAEALDDARTKNEPMSLLMCDIDYFKTFNDNFGHLTGDQVLRLVAGTIKQTVKGQDVAARYGGEEFAVVLPATALEAAVTVAEHIRCAVMGKELVKRTTGEQLGRITISIGAALLRPSDSAQTLIERADNCLYAAKRNGRNRVVDETDLATGDQIKSARVA